jgi:aspartate/methionine/tyrosine aminotransferase
VKNVEEVLKTAHVALVPGEAFGVKGYAHFAFTEKEII